MGRVRIHVAATRFAAFFAAVGTAVLVHGAAVMEDDGPSVAEARLVTGPHFLPEVSEGRLDGMIVVDLRAPPSVALFARAVEADVSLAGVPVGRATAFRESPFLSSPATFRFHVSIDGADASPALLRLADALETQPARLQVSVEARVVLALGADARLSFDEEVRVVTDPDRASSVPTPAAFTAGVPQGPSRTSEVA